MATFFGEILEPTTRGIFEEFSDDEYDTKPIEFCLCWSEVKGTVPSSLDTVFIYHGKLSVAFAEAYLTPENLLSIGEITLVEKDDINEENLSCLKPKFLPSRLYLDNNVGICLISPTYSSDLAFKFTECISEVLKIAKHIIVFTDESISNYKAQIVNDLPPSFMRQLKTSHSSSDYIVKELPVPNIIAGIPAAIASWCQIKKKDSSLFICYTDQRKLDSFTAAPYLSVIKKLRHQLIKNHNPDLSRKKFYGNPDVIGGSSNIYI